MSYTFSDLQAEVKRRSIRDQGGTQFDTEVKLAINTSLFRLVRETNWKPLRRKATFNTEAEYSTGTGAVTATEDSTAITVTGATFITDNIKIGRRIQIQGSTQQYTIASITGETTLTLNIAYDGETDTDYTYKIYGTEEFNLPIQTGKIAAVWHEAFGYPYLLDYLPEQEWLESSTVFTTTGNPTHYRMWGSDNVLEQPYAASALRVSSSSSSDISIDITVFGTVSGYPDYETITTDSSDGTTAVSGTKSFSSVERITKSATSVGRITVDANSANTTVAVLPVGDTTGAVFYKKVQFYPLPTSAFPIYVQYYKEPWRLVGDSDIHELGGEFDEAIICLATAKVKLGQNQAEADKYFALYRDELRSLKKINADTNLDYVPTLRRARDGRGGGRGLHPQLRWTQLGGYFGPKV